MTQRKPKQPSVWVVERGPDEFGRDERVEPVSHRTQASAELEKQSLEESMYGMVYEVVEYRRITPKRPKARRNQP